MINPANRYAASWPIVKGQSSIATFSNLLAHVFFVLQKSADIMLKFHDF